MSSTGPGEGEGKRKRVALLCIHHWFGIIGGNLILDHPFLLPIMNHTGPVGISAVTLMS